jgi:ribonuclease D
MTLITTNSALKSLCADLKSAPFITVDTEFLRDKTYYAKLCLLQLSAPDKKPFAIDVLSTEDDLDLTPVWDLLCHTPNLKVFHAARQDLEIIYQLSGHMVHPIFDTQVAAMVCGFGDQVGYDSLVLSVTGERPDKSSQFTDWSYRPLSSRQLNYALNDVTHLVDIYLMLKAKLEKTNRLDWVNEEMAYLTSPALYTINPDTTWERLKIRSAKPKDMAVIATLCAWREREAQRRDVPRARILKDETLLDLGYQKPLNADDLMRIRGITSDMAKGKFGVSILDVIAQGVKMPPELIPVLPEKNPLPQKLSPVLEMLKMLLRIQAAQHDVVPRLIADNDELEDFVRNPQNTQCSFLQGWRYDVFGKAAQKMLDGRMALGLKNQQITLMTLESSS